MIGRLIQTAKSAYHFPLLFKHIWNTPLLQARDQQVVYRDAKRFTYVEIWERINRLASALAATASSPATRSAFSTGTATAFSKPFSRFR